MAIKIKAKVVERDMFIVEMCGGTKRCAAMDILLLSKCIHSGCNFAEASVKKRINDAR